MSQVTLLTGPERRRRWSLAERETVLAEAFAPGGVVADVARRFDISTSLIYRWRQGYLAKSTKGFAPVMLAAPEPSVDPSPGVIEVELPSGVRLRVVGAVRPDLAVAVLGALAKR